MSDRAIFENANSIVCDNNGLSESKNSVEIARPKLSDAFDNLITREEAEELARRAVQSPKVELIGYHLRNYSEEKLGYLASHLSLLVVYRQPCQQWENESRRFFVKTLPRDVPSQTAFIQETGCFRKEVDFFRLLVPLMMENFRGESWSPKCYLAKENVLVFEDLNMKGYSNRSRLLDETSLRSALACIARFHAASLLAEERIRAGKSIKEAFPDLLEEANFKRQGLSYTWYSVAINLAVSIANELGLDSSNIERACGRLFDACTPSRTKRNVVSHGDLWSSNMLFDAADRCNLIDFQLVRYSPLAHDVMQLLYLCAPLDVRRKHERRLIEHYYDHLARTLQANDFSGDVPDFEEVLQGAEEQRFAALVVTVIFQPSTLMDGKVAARIMNDPVTYEAYHFKDRKPFVDEIAASYPEYGRKLRENVRELVEMCSMLDDLPEPT